MESKGVVLAPDWFNRPALEVTEDLLGKWLCRRASDAQIIRMRITEVEAYDGPDDRACHAHKGKTARTGVMFGPAGHWYVYLCYGVHWMLNIVTGPVDYPAAVLVRGVGDVVGPGRTTKALNIAKDLNEQPALPESGLWLEDDGWRAHDFERTPRIGIDYAGETWANVPYRYVLPQRGQSFEDQGKSVSVLAS